MRISCPHCGYAKEIDDEQIPANVVKVTCPECRQPFPLRREPTVKSDSPTVPDNAEPLTEIADEPPESEPEDTMQAEPEVEVAVPSAAAHEYSTGSEPVKAVATTESVPSEPATVAARYAALLLDGMLILIMILVLRGGLNLLGNGVQLEGQLLLGSLFMLFALTLGFAYHTLFIGVCGQTPGKMLLRIQVVTTDYAAINYRQAMLREVLGKTLSFPLLLGYLMALFNPRHFAAHDKIADTCVIKLTTETTAD